MLFLIPKVVSIIAAGVFAFYTDAASGWKAVAVALVFLSLFLQHTLDSGGAYLAGLFIQVALSVALLIYLKLR